MTARASMDPYDAYPTKSESIAVGFEQSEIVLRKQTIKEIRDFLGDPKPLVKGEAFFEIFNDNVKATKSEYIKLFDKKGSPADTLTWYAVCGNNLDEKDSRVDKRRAPIADFIDDALSKMFMKKMAPVRATAKFFNYGTGVDFYTPRIVKHDLRKICKDESALLSIRPNPRSPIATKIVIDGKSYDSLFSYMIDNIKPEVLNETLDKNFAASINFDAWWDKVVTPKVSIAYDDFMKGYNDLLQNKYRKAIDNGLARAESKKGFTYLNEIFKGTRENPDGPSQIDLAKYAYNALNPRAFYGNAKSLIQSYYDELNSYLKILNTMYILAPERQFLLQTPEGTAKFAAENKVVQGRITNIRYTVYSMLNDFRNFNEAPLAPADEGQVPSLKLAVDQATKVSDKYALLLIEMTALNSILGFKNEVVSAAALKTTHFLGKTARKEPFMAATPSQQIEFRVENDTSVKTPFYQYSNLGPKVNSQQMLTYGIDDTNAKIVGSEIQLSSNFKANDRLAFTLNLSNQLFIMAEDLFKNISILNAAKIDNTYEHLDSGDSKKGSGSRPF